MDEDELARRGLSAITCRPDAGQDSTVPEAHHGVGFGTTRTEARIAVPTIPQCAVSDRETEGKNTGRLNLGVGDAQQVGAMDHMVAGDGSVYLVDAGWALD
jgi:hypothetical protein